MKVQYFQNILIITLHNPKEFLVEGRLRLAIGDEWMGLVKLGRLKMNLVGECCTSRELLHKSQYPTRFLSEIVSANLKTEIRPELIWAVIKEESRFSPGVQSSAGAIGLMQVLPATANELALDNDDLLANKTTDNILIADG